MELFVWVVVAWNVADAVLTVGQVGKIRRPIEPGAAAVVVLIHLAFAAAGLWAVLD